MKFFDKLFKHKEPDPEPMEKDKQCLSCVNRRLNQMGSGSQRFMRARQCPECGVIYASEY